MAIIKSASVKIMLSYDYSHFETSLAIENCNGLDAFDVDNARKECQRLCDKAVKQYQIAKNLAAKRSDGLYQMQNFETECKRIEAKPEQDRTLKEIAMLKQYKEEKWQDQFQHRYDYEDDYNEEL